MSKAFTHDFIDYFTAKDHVCLETAGKMLKELLDECDTENVLGMADESTLHTFESQLGAFLRGYLVGHGGHGGQEEILETVINNICPHCLEYWCKAHDECCIGHALEHFMNDAFKESMMMVEVAGGASPHGDPSLN